MMIDSAVTEVAAGGAIDDNFGRQGSFSTYMLVYVRRSAAASLFAPIPDNEIPHVALSFVAAQAARREGERYTVNFSLITEASLERAAAAHAFGLYAAGVDAERAAILAFDVRQSCAELRARVVGAFTVDSCELYVSDMPIPDRDSSGRPSFAYSDDGVAQLKHGNGFRSHPTHGRGMAWGQRASRPTHGRGAHENAFTSSVRAFARCLSSPRPPLTFDRLVTSGVLEIPFEGCLNGVSCWRGTFESKWNSNSHFPRNHTTGED
jgi:hypothetical protein